jgi:hypothetical protein
MRSFVRFAVTVLAVVGLAAAALADGVPAPVAEVSGAPLTIFSGAGGQCGEYDFVDAPARAFRDHAGTVHLFAAGDHNRQFTGPGLLDVTYRCDVGFKGARDGNPGDYDDYGWLTAFFTTDGVTVDALIHNEFHGSEHPELCPKPGSLGCWETDIVAARSRDGGFTFQRIPAPRGLVAALPYRFDGGRKKQTGFFNPSNIIRIKQSYYVMIPMINPVDDVSGICLLKTDTLDDPTSWRGWDGSSFSVKFLDPYTQDLRSPKPSLCEPVGKGKLMFGLGSVSLHVSSGFYVAVMRFNRWDKPTLGEQPGVYLSLSKDLIHWSDPSLVLSDARARRPGATSDPIEYYPALLDPRAKDRNFGDVTDAPFLFTVQSTPGQPTHDRNLVAWPIHLNLK